jgi:hypothetical protein
VVRDEVWEQLGDLYGPSLFMNYPSDRVQAHAFNRVERAVERWPDLLAEEIVVDQVRHSSSGLEALHMRVIEGHWGWLGKHASSVTGSEGDTRTNAVIVDVEDPISEEMVEITQARWGSDVRLRFAPGSRMIEQ